MKRLLLAAVAAFGLAGTAEAGGCGSRAFVSSRGVTFIDVDALRQAESARIRSEQLYLQAQYGGRAVVFVEDRRPVRRDEVRVFVDRRGNVVAQSSGRGQPQAQAVGDDFAVVRTGGLRGLLFGDVSRAR